MRGTDGRRRRLHPIALVAAALCVFVFWVPVGLAGKPHQGTTGSTEPSGTTGTTGSTGTTGTTGSTGSGGFGANGPFGEVTIKCKLKKHRKKIKCRLDFIPAKAPRKVSGNLSRHHKKLAKGKAKVADATAILGLKKTKRVNKLKKGKYLLTIVGTYGDGSKAKAKGPVNVR